ncbi:MAG TPA: MarC family protein [Myxococcales bacterium]
MRDFLSYSLVAFSAIFFVIDPLGLVPIYVAITSRDPPEKRRKMARRATLVAFCLLSFFAVFGSLLFKVFGITLSAFKIAGGILLLITAIDMLRAQPSRTRSSPEETEESDAKEDVAIVPLAMPLLAGPGAIATVMVVAGRGKDWLHLIPVLLSIGLTCAIAYALLRVASRIQKLFGHGGIAVLERVMGLLLAAIAVQFISDGAVEIFQAVPPSAPLG